jgi:hypothetical protein
MWKSKTVYTALAACITSFGAFMASEISLTEMFQVIVPSVLAICLRHSVKKAQDSVEDATGTIKKVSAKIKRGA